MDENSLTQKCRSSYEIASVVTFMHTFYNMSVSSLQCLESGMPGVTEVTSLPHLV